MIKFAFFEPFGKALCLLLFVILTREVFSRQSTEYFQKPLQKCWELRNPGIDSFASDNVNLIISQTDGNLVSLDRYSSDQIWKTSIGDKNNSIIKLIQGKILVFTLETTSGSDLEKTLSIRYVEGLSGVVKELREFPKIIGQAGTNNTTAKHIFYAGADSEIIEINLEDESQIRFSTNISGDSEKFSIDENTISDGSGSYFAFSKGSEIILIKNSFENNSRKIKTTSEEITALTFNDGSLFWGDDSGKVFQQDPNKKSFDKVLRTGGKVSFLQNIDKDLLITSNDNYIYLYSPKNKKQIWKRRLAGRATIRPKLQKDLIAVTTNAEPDIFLMDLENGKIFNQITLPEETFIRDFQLENDSLYVHTNLGLIRFSEDCSK